jgi:hypothetical protein
MRGARTEFRTMDKNYAYEFYHGRLGEAEMDRHRAKRAAILAEAAYWERVLREKAEAERKAAAARQKKENAK